MNIKTDSYTELKALVSLLDEPLEENYFSIRSKVSAYGLEAVPYLEDASKNSSVQPLTIRPVIIEDDCWLATNVVVNKGVRLGKGTVIASNAVVTNDTEEYSINGGVPAKIIGSVKDKDEAFLKEFPELRNTYMK